MNVRFYGVNAQAGTAALAQHLGGEHLVLRPVDVYTRHHREQLLGASLTVRSGVVGAGPDGLRLYHELANTETDDLAATFVHRVRAEDPGGTVIALPTAPLERARDLVGAVPAQGATRSISLDTDPVATAPELAELHTRNLAMRKVREIGPEECNPDGSFIWAFAPVLTWGGEPVHRRMPEMLHTGPNGERMGWASMETRMVINRVPRLGDRIQSFSAVLSIPDKTSHRIQWAYDVDRGDLLTTFEVVNLAFDIDRRRPMSIPTDLRAMEESVLYPDLAPRVNSSANFA